MSITLALVAEVVTGQEDSGLWEGATDDGGGDNRGKCKVFVSME